MGLRGLQEYDNLLIINWLLKIQGWNFEPVSGCAA